MPLVRIVDLADGQVVDGNLHKISLALDAEFARSRLNGGEILISIQGTIGRIAICSKDFAGANISRTIARIDPNHRVDRRYLFHYLRSLEGRFETAGSTRASLNIGTLRKLEVPLPPIREQRRIAAVLDAADALRAKRRQALAKLDTLTQVIFMDMFGDPKTTGADDPPLGEVLVLQRGYDLPVQCRVEGDFEVWAANGPVGTHDVPKVKGPGVTTGRSGTVGKVHFVAEDFWPLNTALYVKDFKGNDPFYCSELLRHFHLERFSRGVGVPTLNRNLVHAAPVRVAPRAAQETFTARALAANQELGRQMRQLDALDLLFASLQQRAFRGEL